MLPFACDLELICRVRRADRVELVSGAEEVSFALDEAMRPEGWGAYVWGVVRALEDAGMHPAGIAGSITSTIPAGAGLSSSAALEAAVALALTGGAPPSPEVLQEAEQLATGVPCGVMDQTAVLRARAETALELDCSTGTDTHVPIPEAVAFAVIDTGTRRQLRDGRYAERRREVERELERSGAATLADLASRPSTPRLRHAFDELERVGAAVGALASGDVDALGEIVDASHDSLRDDFEVSSPALDLAVAEARRCGASGARLVGAGFAGCVLAVVEADSVDDVVERAADALRERLPLAWARRVLAVDAAGEAPR